jgi:2-haloacid dehalogenase
MLSALKAQGLSTAILSNGTPEMLKAAVQSAGIGDMLDDTLSVESVGIFKPDARVYQLVTERFSCTPSQVLFVSSNGWDAAAAAGFGFHVTWVNRAASPVDRLPSRPAHILTDLSGIPEIAQS